MQTAIEWYWARIADLPHAEAIRRGWAQRCPICGTVHPGVRYLLRSHWKFCGTKCFREGIRRERAGGTTE